MQNGRVMAVNSSTNPVVKSGKTSHTGVTDATVKRLERIGSSESAKIARDYVKK